MVLGSLHDLHYLPKLNINGYAKMKNLPAGALQNLTSLQELRIEACDNLKTLPVQLKSLTTLTKLTICYCRNLVSLAEGEGGLRNLSSLKTLHIGYCYALKHLPELDKTSLVDLDISDCPEMEFSTNDFEHLVVLEKLTLLRLPTLTCFPKGGSRNLSSLKTLHIYDCNALKHLPQFHKTSLVDLAIRNCPQMEFSTDDFEHLVVLERLKLSELPTSTCFPKGGPRNLSTLKILHIYGCDALKRLPEFHKTSLVHLAISNSPQMEFSTDDFEHLVVLEWLQLSRLPKLKFFPEGIKHTAETLHRLDFQPCSENGAMDLPDWISTLTSLQYLSISVPKNWKMLPQWLQDFTALYDLSIYGCDEELERRWKNRQRNDNCFKMISHVRYVAISSNVWSDGYY